MSETTKNIHEWQIRHDAPLLQTRAATLEEVGDLSEAAQNEIHAVEARVAAAEARIAGLADSIGRVAARTHDLEQGGQGKGTPLQEPGTTGQSACPSSGKVAASPAAPTAVQAPRGFREGDICRVIESPRTRDNDLVGCEGPIRAYRGTGGDWEIYCGPKRHTRIFYNRELTLVHAADAPAESYLGLVERLANLEWINGLRKSSEESAKAILAFLGAEGRLCAPGEVERLTKAREVAESRQAVAEDECADLRAKLAAEEKAHADDHRVLDGRVRRAEEEVRNYKAKLAAAEQALDVERRTETECGALEPGTNYHCCLPRGHDFATRHVAFGAHLPRLGAVGMWDTGKKPERDALRAELDALKAKPRGKTRKVRAEDASAFYAEWFKSGYGSNYDERARAMNAVGLRMRVGGAR